MTESRGCVEQGGQSKIKWVGLMMEETFLALAAVRVLNHSDDVISDGLYSKPVSSFLVFLYSHEFILL